MESFVTDLCFVYGTLKRGHGNDVIFQDCGSEWMGEHTLEDNYLMLNYGCPMIYPEYHPSVTPDDVCLPVLGEVWKVDPEREQETMYRLDRLEGEGSLYSRKVRRTTEGLLVYTYEGISRWCDDTRTANTNNGAYQW